MTLDPYIETILHQTPFVTGYHMTSQDKWSRMGIEGFLYVVTRTKSPKYSFILVNKKSENHLIEHLTPEFQMNSSGNFIFYRSLDITRNFLNNLQGLWFFDENECKLTYEKLGEITNRKSTLDFNINAISSLCSELNEVNTLNTNTQSKPDASPTSQIKSIGSFILNAINFNKSVSNADSKTSTSPKADTISITKSIFKTNETSNHEEVEKKAEKLEVESKNVHGKHLMSLLKTSKNEEKSPKQPPKRAPKSPVNRPETPQSPETRTVKVTYEGLKKVISEVVQSEEFISLIWKKLNQHNP
ncbi:Dcp1-like decapping family protein [Theileria parva strain Muguga]|uniref:Dcp1-like decapping family protein n=1 Tax=Theileria parva strain Muguga TaxID=333668 RepID=UPI001C618DB6|nr:Dcp1-like decapping family protein [Theileria parva strain Muguga]EAN32110.2 Dcp1-like decapping family protein [Theileria parva strain Muguga]